MRLFIALELPDDTRQWLAEVGRKVRSEVPKTRWVRPELMHLTLVFLGETDEARIPDLDRGVGQAVAGWPAMEIQVGGFGTFPARGRARVAWVGLETETDLDALQAAVAEAVESAGGPTEDHGKKKRFHPHVTLARCQPTWPRWAVEKLEKSFIGRPAPAAFHVDQVSLIASELGKGQSGGPRYRTLSTYPLGGLA